VHQPTKFNYQLKKMKLTFPLNFFANITMLVGILAANLLVASTTQAQEKRNDAGLAIQFGNSTSIGIQGKIGVSDNFSIRPEFFFGGGGAVQNSTFTTAAPFPIPTTITAPTSLILPAISGPITLAVPLTIPRDFTTTSSIVLNGNTIPAGSVIRAGTIIPAGSVIPAGNVIPAGTVLTTGTNVPANTIIPTGTVIPAGTIGSRLSGGTSFGLAATYDFKLDQQGKSTAYIGPKIAFSSASGPATINGADIAGSNLNVSETKIGLVFGADYGISNDLTIGANFTYNLSRSVNTSGSFGVVNGNINGVTQSAGGSSLDFGIRAAYRF
jgi:acetyltransferase-like isoleucine patch superfamily enzyme